MSAFDPKRTGRGSRNDERCDTYVVCGGQCLQLLVGLPPVDESIRSLRAAWNKVAQPMDLRHLLVDWQWLGCASTWCERSRATHSCGLASCQANVRFWPLAVIGIG